MKRYSIVLLIVLAAGLAAANAMLIWQDYDSNKVTEHDLRGIYTYPGIGAMFVNGRKFDIPTSAALTLVIFFSAETQCLHCLKEVASYKHLDSVFCERGQRVVALTIQQDSAAIATFLEKEDLDIPLVVSLLGMSFEDMGISPSFMPFKVLYDSTLTAIYMRGANNTPKSQGEFEAAMLWLSEAIHHKTKVAKSL